MIIEIFQSTGKVIRRLGYHESIPQNACEDFNANLDDDIQYIDNSESSTDFSELVRLYVDREGTSAPTGYYSDGNIIRYYLFTAGGGAFTDGFYPPTVCGNALTYKKLVKVDENYQYGDVIDENNISYYYIEGNTLSESSGIWTDALRLNPATDGTYFDYGFTENHTLNQLSADSLHKYLNNGNAAIDYTISETTTHDVISSVGTSLIISGNLDVGDIYIIDYAGKSLVIELFTILGANTLITNFDTFDFECEAGSCSIQVTVHKISNRQYYAFTQYGSTGDISKWSNGTLTNINVDFNILGATFIKSYVADKIDGGINIVCSDFLSSNSLKYLVKSDGTSTFLLSEAVTLYDDFWKTTKPSESQWVTDGITWKYWKAISNSFHDFSDGGTLTVFDTCENRLFFSYVAYTEASSPEDYVTGFCGSAPSYRTVYADGNFIDYTATVMYDREWGESIVSTKGFYRSGNVGNPIKFWNGTSFDSEFYVDCEIIPTTSLSFVYSNENCEICLNPQSSQFRIDSHNDLPGSTKVYSDPFGETLLGIDVVLRQGEIVRMWDASAEAFVNLDNCIQKTEVNVQISDTLSLCASTIEIKYVDDINDIQNSRIYNDEYACTLVDGDKYIRIVDTDTVYHWLTEQTFGADEYLSDCSTLPLLTNVYFSNNNYSLCGNDDTTLLSALVDVYGDGTTITDSEHIYDDIYGEVLAPVGFYYDSSTGIYREWDGNSFVGNSTCVDRTQLTLKIEDALDYVCKTSKDITVWVDNGMAFTAMTALYAGQYSPEILDTTVHVDNDGTTNMGRVFLLDTDSNYIRLWDSPTSSFDTQFDTESEATRRCKTHPRMVRMGYNVSNPSTACKQLYMESNYPAMTSVAFDVYMDDDNNPTTFGDNSYGDTIYSGYYSDGTNVYHWDGVTVSVESDCVIFPSIDLQYESNVSLSGEQLCDAENASLATTYYIDGTTTSNSTIISDDPYAIQLAATGLYIGGSRFVTFTNNGNGTGTISELSACVSFQLNNGYFLFDTTDSAVCNTLNTSQQYYFDGTDLATSTKLTTDIYGLVNAPANWYIEAATLQRREWNGTAFVAAADLCADVYSIQLTHDSTSNTQTACDGTLSQYYIDSQSFNNVTKIYTDSLGNDLAPSGIYSDGTGFVQWTGIGIQIPYTTCGDLYPYDLVYSDSADDVCLKEESDKTTYYGDTPLFENATMLYSSALGSPDDNHNGIQATGYYSDLNGTHRFFVGVVNMAVANPTPTANPMGLALATVCDTMTQITLAYNSVDGTNVCPGDDNYTLGTFWIKGTGLGDAEGNVYTGEDKSGAQSDQWWYDPNTGYKRQVSGGNFVASSYQEAICSTITEINLQYINDTSTHRGDSHNVSIYSACDFSSPSPLFIDKAQFNLCENIYTDNTTTTKVSAGIYSDGTIWRLWDGNEFTLYDGIGNKVYECDDLHRPLLVYKSSNNSDICSINTTSTVYAKYFNDTDLSIGNIDDITNQIYPPYGIHESIYFKDNGSDVHFWNGDPAIRAVNPEGTVIDNPTCGQMTLISLQSQISNSSTYMTGLCSNSNNITPVNYYINAATFTEATKIYTSAGLYGHDVNLVPVTNDNQWIHFYDNEGDAATGGTIRTWNGTSFEETDGICQVYPGFHVLTNLGEGVDNVCTVDDSVLPNVMVHFNIGATSILDATHLYSDSWGEAIFSLTADILQRYDGDGTVGNNYLNKKRTWTYDIDTQTGSFGPASNCFVYNNTITVKTSETLGGICGSTNEQTFYLYSPSETFETATTLLTDQYGTVYDGPSIYLYDETLNLIRYYDMSPIATGSVTLKKFNNNAMSGTPGDVNYEKCSLYPHEFTVSFHGTDSGYACSYDQIKDHTLIDFNTIEYGIEKTIYGANATFDQNTSFSDSEFANINIATGHYSDGTDFVSYDGIGGFVWNTCSLNSNLLSYGLLYNTNYDVAYNTDRFVSCYDNINENNLLGSESNVHQHNIDATTNTLKLDSWGNIPAPEGFYSVKITGAADTTAISIYSNGEQIIDAVPATPGTNESCNSYALNPVTLAYSPTSRILACANYNNGNTQVYYTNSSFTGSSAILNDIHGQQEKQLFNTLWGHAIDPSDHVLGGYYSDGNYTIKLNDNGTISSVFGSPGALEPFSACISIEDTGNIEYLDTAYTYNNLINLCDNDNGYFHNHTAYSYDYFDVEGMSKYPYLNHPIGENNLWNNSNLTTSLSNGQGSEVYRTDFCMFTYDGTGMISKGICNPEVSYQFSPSSSAAITSPSGFVNEIDPEWGNSTSKYILPHNYDAVGSPLIISTIVNSSRMAKVVEHEGSDIYIPPTNGRYYDGIGFRQCNDGVFVGDYIQLGAVSLNYSNSILNTCGNSAGAYLFNANPDGTETAFVDATSIYKLNTEGTMWIKETTSGFYSMNGSVRYLNSSGVFSNNVFGCVSYELNYNVSKDNICGEFGNPTETYVFDFQLTTADFDKAKAVFKLSGDSMIIAPDGYYLDSNGEYREFTNGKFAGVASICTFNTPITLAHDTILSHDYMNGVDLTESEYFIDGDSLGTSTEVYTDITGSTKANIGFYRDNNNYKYFDGIRFTTPLIKLGRWEIELSSGQTGNNACVFASTQTLYIDYTETQTPGGLQQYAIVFNNPLNDSVPSHRVEYSDGDVSASIDTRGIVGATTICNIAPFAGAPATNRSGFELAYDGADFATATVAESNTKNPAPEGVYNNGTVSRYFDGKKLGQVFTFRQGYSVELATSRITEGDACDRFSSGRTKRYFMDVDDPGIRYANSLWADEDMTIPAPEGYYVDQFGDIRKWLPETMQLLTSPNTCSTL